MTRTAAFSAKAPYCFLIIGYGSELQGDEAAGLCVAETVSKWQLSTVKSIATPQLAPELVDDLVETDYAIFVDACSGASGARTVQIDPIVIGAHSPRTLSNQIPMPNPLTLLNLAQELYGYSPQSWLLKVPVESFNLGENLSSTAQQGCDRAVRTIEQFLRTYHRSAWMKQKVCMTLA